MQIRHSPHGRFAALDLGSLTVRLAVAQCTAPGRFQVLVHRREVTALGQEVSRTGELAPEAMARTLKALAGFRQVLEDHGVEACRAVGTQALRQARNREVFLNQVRDTLGWEVRVLSPQEEARLSLAGVLSALASPYLQEPALLVVDVGGGSSEWALVRPGQPAVFASLPLGVLTLSQTHPVGDPPRLARVAALQQEVAQRLGRFYEEIFRPHLPEAPRLVGTAGAVTTLAAMQLQLDRYDPRRINNLILTRSQVEHLAELVSHLPEADRARLPGMEPAKAGVMVAGAWIILAILWVCNQDSLVVIDAGLLEGILREMISQTQVSSF